MTNSVVMIVPSPHRAALNGLGQQMGYGPDTWNVPLSASGALPTTHYGTHTWEQAGGQFRQLRLAVQAGITPPGLEPYAAALASLYVRAVEDSLDASSNWQAALTETGLEVIEE